MWRKVHGQSHVESQAAFVRRHHRRVLLILTSQDGDDCSPDRVYRRMERRLVVREARMSNVQRKGHFGAKMAEAYCAQDKKAAAAAALDPHTAGCQHGLASSVSNDRDHHTAVAWTWTQLVNDAGAVAVVVVVVERGAGAVTGGRRCCLWSANAVSQVEIV